MIPGYICGIVAVAVSFLTFVAIKGLDRLRRRDAETEAEQIVDTAQQEAHRLRRETELELKEQAIQQKAEGERELRKLREELHERERILDKRQDALEKQAEQLQKQEKIVESTQRKLTERIQDTNRRQAELSKLLDLQRQTLHELSGLGREEAVTRLLEDLGLVDFMVGLRGVTGDSATVTAHLKELQARGVSCLLVPLPGNADPEGTLVRVSEAARVT